MGDGPRLADYLAAQRWVRSIRARRQLGALRAELLGDHDLDQLLLGWRTDGRVAVDQTADDDLPELADREILTAPALAPPASPAPSHAGVTA